MTDATQPDSSSTGHDVPPTPAATPTTPPASSNTVVEALGWYGTVAIVLAYALNSFEVLDTESVGYQVLNLTGAIGIITVSWAKRVIQPAVLNVVWAFIAAAALLGLSV